MEVTTLEDAQAMITSQREEIENLRKENGELKKRLGEGDVDEDVKKYLEDKFKKDQANAERQKTIKEGLV